jgi:hypothetical protein
VSFNNLKITPLPAGPIMVQPFFHFTKMEAESPIAVDILAFLPSHQKAAN